MNFILLGAPGTGKGTMSKRLVRDVNVVHISTGDLFRQNIAEETKLGQLAKTYISRGELVPDQITIDMVRERLASPDCDKGFVLDGFPRTIPQADELFKILEELGRPLHAVLDLYIEDEEFIVRRLADRLVCEGCGQPYNRVSAIPKVDGVCDYCGGVVRRRKDDEPDTVRARLAVYHERTEPLIAYYEERGLLQPIEASGDQEETLRKALACLGQVHEDNGNLND